MKLLRVRMMRPYLCLMGGNGVFCEQVIQGAHGGRSRGQGGGRCFDLDIPPPTPPAATASSASAGSAGRGIVIDNSKRMIKLIKPDGVVTLYERPIKASELMEEYPKHRVCSSDSFYIGQKIPHLSEQDKLQKGHTYFLLPSHIFHSVLSFVTIASFASPPPPLPRPPPPPQPSTSTQPPPASVLGAAAANSNINNSVTASLRSKREEEEEQMKSRAAILKKAAGASRMSSSSPPAFDIQKTKSGTLRIRVSEVFISQLIMDQQRDYEKEEEAELEKEEEEKKKRLLCTTPQLHKDYKQLVMGSRVRHWKPKLDMISETSSTTIININTPNKEKRKALLSSASFGIRRNKKPSSSTTTSSCKITYTRESSSSSSNQSSSSSSSNSANQQRQQQHVLDDQPIIHGQSQSGQRELVLLVPSSKSTSTAKPPTACKCKLRRFKLKLGGLTTTTTTSTSSTSTPASSRKSGSWDSKHSIYNS